MHPRATATGTKTRMGTSMMPPRRASRVVRSPRNSVSSCLSHPPPVIAAISGSLREGPGNRPTASETPSLNMYATSGLFGRGDEPLAAAAGEDPEEGLDIGVGAKVAV